MSWAPERSQGLQVTKMGHGDPSAPRNHEKRAREPVTPWDATRGSEMERRVVNTIGLKPSVALP